MNWLLAGIAPSILWSVVNHTDKYLLTKTKHESSVGVLMVYSTLFSFVVLPFVFYFSYSQIFINWTQVVVQIIGGVLITLSIYFYLVALHKDEASVVMPFALLVPVFGYVLSYLILGEVLSFKQLISCMLIVVGAFVLSLEFEEERKLRIKHGVLFAMILCTLFQAVQETLFKLVTIENSLSVSFFWLHVGIIICGLVLITIKRGLFGSFVKSIKVNGRLIFGVNFLSEATSAAAYMIRDYATLLAPITVIMTLNGFQPVFVFLIGIFLTLLFPKFATEKIKPIHLIHKGGAIIVMVVGTILITQTL